jgi:enoyl-CoA hydratase
MSSNVTWSTEGEIAWLTMDDGKANALSPALQAELREGLDRARAEERVCVVTGRSGVFSGGFDLKVIAAGGQASTDMVLGGFELALQMATQPRPVVLACPGHAVAMGAFLLLAGDYRIGTEGDFRIMANEVAIGMTMPHTAITLLRARLAPAAFHAATLLARPFEPDSAVGAGWLEEVVSADALAARAQAVAEGLAALDRRAFTATRNRACGDLHAALRAAIDADRAEMSARAGAS